MPINTLFSILILLLFFSLAGAEMYQWVDGKGTVVITDAPPPPSKKRKKVKVYTDGDFAPTPPAQPTPAKRSAKGAAAAASQPSPPRKERFTGTVEMYVTSWCGYCKRAEKYLQSKGIPYVAYDIEKDSAARQRHRELGGNGVPLIIIGSNKMSGFSPETLEHYLNNP